MNVKHGFDRCAESVSDHFVALCKRADALMDNCMLAETSDDIPSALYYCNGALGEYTGE